MLHGAWCPLHGACCPLYVIRCMLHAVRCMVACYTLQVPEMWNATPHISDALSCLAYIVQAATYIDNCNLPDAIPNVERATHRMQCNLLCYTYKMKMQQLLRTSRNAMPHISDASSNRRHCSSWSVLSFHLKPNECNVWYW